MNGKKGVSTSFWVITIGIASAIVGIFILGATMGNFWNSVGQSDKVSTGITSTRLFQAVELVSIDPSSGYTVFLDREYESVDIGGGSAEFFDGEDTVETSFVDGFEGQFSEVSEICVMNSGELEMIQGECSLEGCSAPECIQGNGFGFVCREGVYETDDFYRSFFDQCQDVQESFVNLNRLNCPERAEPGAILTCSADITYRCEGDGYNAILRIGDESVEEEFECTGSTENQFLAVTTAATADGQAYEIDVQGADISEQGVVESR